MYGQKKSARDKRWKSLPDMYSEKSLFEMYSQKKPARDVR